mgnify:CR=1 FL=1
MKRILSLLSLPLFTLFFFACEEEKKAEKVYQPIVESQHPFNAKIYTLENGLTVCLSVNKKEPRAHTLIGVKTGSKNDPSQATGLAHYLEHMLFKGTSKFGTSNWEAEKVYLDTISDLYELHRSTTDSLERYTIYQAIDSLSYIASGFAIANEYDKMNAELGAQGTNAYTSMDETVYTTDIPVSELEKWMKIESERFSELVLRLFHTEIEAVYEEFNIGQDSDDEKAYDAVMESLFKRHTYGTQTTIGKGEHLKNPSHEEIQAYFKKYYVPNNMIVSISGDINIDSTIALVDKYFGTYSATEVPKYSFSPEDEQRKADTLSVFGKEAEYAYLAYRLNGAQEKDRIYLELLDGILNNGSAGLIDLNLLTKQKVLDAWTYAMVNHDYSMLLMAGYPKRRQSLEQVSDLLHQQIEKIKKGDFPDWLPQAVVKNKKLQAIEGMKENRERASQMLYAYINDTGWEQEANLFNEMAKISKEDIVKFANERLTNNHVLVYKRTGERDPFKVSAPEISPIQLNKEANSSFYTELAKMESKEVTPQFLEYKKEIKQTTIGQNLKINTVSNTENELFSLHYVFDFGKWSDKELALAIEYLPYLGTQKYSAEELNEFFFQKGLQFEAKASTNQIIFSIRGLESSLNHGLEMMEHIVKNVQPNKKKYTELVSHKLKKFTDAKLDKTHLLWRGMVNYVKYGFDNPENFVFTKSQLRSLQPTTLTNKLHEIFNYPHEVFYYGSSSAKELAPKIKQYHNLPEDWKSVPEEKSFSKNEEDYDVYFLHHDMVQSEIIFLADKGKFDAEKLGFGTLFNEYLGSLTFREVRESKALAYSCYTSYSSSPRKDYSDYVLAYIGTQSDKFDSAVNAMFELLKSSPDNTSMFTESKTKVLKSIASNRTTGEDIFWNYLKNKQKGIDIDTKRLVYQYTKDIEEDEFTRQFDEFVVPSAFKIIVIGNKEQLNTEQLDRFGKLKELSISDILSY